MVILRRIQHFRRKTEKIVADTVRDVFKNKDNAAQLLQILWEQNKVNDIITNLKRQDDRQLDMISALIKDIVK